MQTSDLPLLVFANKRDSDHAEDMKKIKSLFKECADVIGQRDCVVLPCSALKVPYLIFTCTHYNVSYNVLFEFNDWSVTY